MHTYPIYIQVYSCDFCSQQLDASTRPPLSAENSFDSVDTECSSTTDLSRPEALTTSFDSTTDCPTDSTSDTHSHRLQQMKADSGYRSLEANNGRPPKLSKKQIHFMEDSVEVTEVDVERDRSRERPRSTDFSQDLPDELGDPQSKRERLRKSFAQFERRTSKSLTRSAERPCAKDTLPSTRRSASPSPAPSSAWEAALRSTPPPPTRSAARGPCSRGSSGRTGTRRPTIAFCSATIP